jgi:uncharacterized membrane protein YoaK (UPF0700 family)
MVLSDSTDRRDRAAARVPLRHRLHALPVIPLMALTFSTGIIDAFGYLALDKVFAGNMTGNVVILGMALMGTGLPVVGPLLALVAFMLGAAIVGRVLRGVPIGWTPRTRAVLVGVAVLVAATTVLVALSGLDMPATGVLAIAMGGQAAAARHVRVADVTTVVVTSTLTGLAADSWVGMRTEQPWARRLTAVALMLLGAMLGALLLHVHVFLPLALSAAITLAVALAFPVRGPRAE